MQQNREPLLKLQPRGLPRPMAAAYVGVSVSTFDKLVDDGIMPKAKRLRSRLIFDVRQLDIAIDQLPNDGDDEVSTWD